VRRFAGWALLTLAGGCSLLSLLADPYTSWGVEDEQVRPGPAAASVALALVSLALLGAAAWLVYRDRANRRGAPAWPFAAALMALAAADLARVVWIRFFVLG
jgi:hypothetical protein